MTFVLVLIVISSAVVLGWGTLTERYVLGCHSGGDPELAFGEIGLLGLATLACLATTINFVVGLQPIVASLAILGGVVGFVRAVYAGRFRNKAYIFVAAILILKTVVYFTFVTSSAQDSDTGLYHIPSIILAAQEPTVIGQASLHMRFGYNSLVFPLSAILAIPKIGVGAYYVVNPTFYILLFLAVLERTLCASNSPGCSRVLWFGFGTLAALLVNGVVFDNIGTPTSDITANCLVIYVFFLATYISCLRAAAHTAKDAATVVTFTLVMVAFAVTCKLTAAPIAFALVILMRPPPGQSWKKAGIVKGLWLTAPLGLVWLVRGIMTSGCLAYPNAKTCLPLPWTIPTNAASDDFAWMRSWARTPEIKPDLVLGKWDWLPAWWQSFKLEGTVQFVQILLAVGILIFLVMKALGIKSAWSVSSKIQKLDICLLAGVSLIGFAYWFSIAPLPRYGIGWILSPFLLAFSSIAPAPPAHLSEKVTPAASYGRIAFKILARRRDAGLRKDLRCLRLAVLASLARISVRLAVSSLGIYASLQLVLFLLKSAAIGGFPNTPPFDVGAQITSSGLAVNVPRRSALCWDAPPFCTPYFDRHLSAKSYGPWRILYFVDDLKR